MNIGEPKRTIEVEPVTLPVPEPLPIEEPAPADVPAPVPDAVPAEPVPSEPRRPMPSLPRGARRIPDVIEPIIGWRVWSLRSVRGRLELRAVVHDTPWPGGRALGRSR
jgi:hypothetical protein